MWITLAYFEDEPIIMWGNAMSEPLVRRTEAGAKSGENNCSTRFQLVLWPFSVFITCPPRTFCCFRRPQQARQLPRLTYGCRFGPFDLHLHARCPGHVFRLSYGVVTYDRRPCEKRWYTTILSTPLREQTQPCKIPHHSLLCCVSSASFRSCC
ncbi:hypothetical protein BCV70DRAFT_198177 [Testicularia cyperi]|uniref:Uncharacterized protein n=1 Tax=Testicularia cyperi TaxID=1882483 RepID=A0A317XU66_9BASI|nr:hypothetical protein BCV70DRAFT_198177 [Testicularia cyperi]